MLNPFNTLSSNQYFHHLISIPKFAARSFVVVGLFLYGRENLKIASGLPTKKFFDADLAGPVAFYLG